MKLRLLLFSILMFLTIAGISCLMLLRFIHLTPSSYTTYVPKNPDWKLEIDALQLLKSEIAVLLFDAKEPMVVQSLEQKLRNRMTADDQSNQLGIDLEQKIMAYGYNSKNQHYTVFVFTIKNPEQFKSNFKTTETNRFAYTLKENTVFLIMNNSKEEPKNVLQRLVQKISSSSIAQKTAFSTEDDITFLRVSLKNAGIDKEAKNVNFEVRANRKGFKLSGELQLDHKRFHQPNYDLKPKGLYIATALIPKPLTDTLNAFIKQSLPVNDYQFPTIRSIVCDINGVMIEQSSMGLLPAPKMNMILEFDEAINLEVLMKSFPVDMVRPMNKLKVGSIEYQLMCLDNKTLFIGTNPTLIRKAKLNQVSRIKGSLNALTQIGGSQMVMAFLDVIPAVVASKQFISGTEKVDFDITQRKNGSCRMKGEVLFKNGLLPQHEVTKLIIGFGALDE